MQLLYEKRILKKFVNKSVIQSVVLICPQKSDTFGGILFGKIFVLMIYGLARSLCEIKRRRSLLSYPNSFHRCIRDTAFELPL